MMKKFLILIFLLELQLNCNRRDQCQASAGYENYDGCLAIIGIYNNLPDERKTTERLNFVLTGCLITHRALESCKTESNRWPLPD